MLKHFLICLCSSLWSFQATTAAEIKVAVASNFSRPMQAIARDFEAQTGHHVTLAFGSSGKLYAQIIHGAPFQAFLSADAAKPVALEEAGLTVPGSRFTYALGTLALWSARPGLVNNSADALKNPTLNKLAIANPRLAPYGSAAIQVLQSLNLYESTATKLVQGENIAQAYQFVHSGNADLGLVALSQVIVDEKLANGSAWIVPQQMHETIRQDAVILRTGTGTGTGTDKDSQATIALMDYLRGDKARKIIQAYGYRATTDGID